MLALKIAQRSLSVLAIRSNTSIQLIKTMSCGCGRRQGNEGNCHNRTSDNTQNLKNKEDSTHECCSKHGEGHECCGKHGEGHEGGCCGKHEEGHECCGKHDGSCGKHGEGHECCGKHDGSCGHHEEGHECCGKHDGSCGHHEEGHEGGCCGKHGEGHEGGCCGHHHDNHETINDNESHLEEGNEEIEEEHDCGCGCGCGCGDHDEDAFEVSTHGPALKVLTIPNGSLSENCYLMWDGVTFKGAIIDPGVQADKILSIVRGIGCDIQQIFCTHGHYDHITASGAIQKALGDIPMRIHKDDEYLIKTLPEICEQMDIELDCLPKNIQTFENGDEFKVGCYSCTALHTPGHTQGSSCFDFHGYLFSGDTLFRHSIGRTDLPEGNRNDIFKSILDTIFKLPTYTTVLPGHGSTTTIKEELKNNPYVRPTSH